MSNYTITTDFRAKDRLPSGNAAKVIKGSEFSVEFTNIKTAVNTKADLNAPNFTGAVDFASTVDIVGDLTVDTNTFHVDVTNNRVGIGTTSPTTALDVTGVITTDGLTSSAGIDVTGTVTASGLTVDTTTLHVDASNDRVGIGTTSPDTLLEVVGADPILTIRDSETTGANTNATLRLAESGGSDTLGNYWDINHTGNGELRFVQDRDDVSNERIRIDYAGNVGIGTSSPSEALEVNGKVKADTHFTSSDNAVTLSTSGNGGNVYLRPNGATQASGQVIVDSSGNVGIGTTSPSQKLHVYHATDNQIATFESGDSTSALKIKDSTDETLVQNIGGIQQFVSNNTNTGTAGTRFLHGSSEKMRIDSSGNVGIGTSSPATSLTVTGSQANGLELDRNDFDNTQSCRLFFDSSTSGFSMFNNSGGLAFCTGAVPNSTSGTEKVRIDSSGRVGIGTSSPDKDLHITNTTEAATIRLERNQSEIPDGGVIGAIEFESRDVSAGSTGVVGKIEVRAEDTTPDTRMAFYTHDNDSGTGSLEERMRIDSSGRVGIGTTSPAEELHISSSVPKIRMQDSDGTNQYGEFYHSAGTTAILARNNTTDGTIVFQKNDGTTTDETMRIDASGNLLVGKTSGAFNDVGHALYATGLVQHTRDDATVLQLNRLTSNGGIVTFHKNGGTEKGSITVTDSTTSYNTSSDERLKENITDSADAGSKIDAIQIRQFDWISDGSHQDYGVIAQELINVTPEAVSEGDTEEDMMGVDYSKLVPMLIKEIQTLRNRVAQLENN